MRKKKIFIEDKLAPFMDFAGLPLDWLSGIGDNFLRAVAILPCLALMITFFIICCLPMLGIILWHLLVIIYKNEK